METDSTEASDTPAVATEIKRALQVRAFVPGSKPRVLILEDDKGQVDDFRFWSEKLGCFEVVAFHNGDDAVEFASSEDIAAAVLDCQVPGSASGVSIGRAIKLHDPTIPIVMRTAFKDSYESAARDAGLKPERWVAKPSKMEELVKMIAEDIWRSLPAALARCAQLAVVREMTRSVIVDEGRVTHVDSCKCSIEFGRGDDRFSRRFPTWRLRLVGADEVDARVSHQMSQYEDMVISRLLRLDEAYSLLTEEPERRLSDEDVRVLNEVMKEGQ